MTGLFSPMARLAALVPRPRANLTRYRGVFAGRCQTRPEQNGAPPEERERSPEPDAIPKAPLTWAERLKRVFGIEITECPHCGGRLRVIADVIDPALIERILGHVRREGLPRASPAQ